MFFFNKFSKKFVSFRTIKVFTKRFFILWAISVLWAISIRYFFTSIWSDIDFNKLDDLRNLFSIVLSVSFIRITVEYLMGGVLYMDNAPSTGGSNSGTTAGNSTGGSGSGGAVGGPSGPGVNVGSSSGTGSGTSAGSYSGTGVASSGVTGNSSTGGGTAAVPAIAQPAVVAAGNWNFTGGIYNITSTAVTFYNAAGAPRLTYVVNGVHYPTQIAQALEHQMLNFNDMSTNTCRQFKYPEFNPNEVRFIQDFIAYRGTKPNMAWNSENFRKALRKLP